MVFRFATILYCLSSRARIAFTLDAEDLGKTKNPPSLLQSTRATMSPASLALHTTQLLTAQSEYLLWNVVVLWLCNTAAEGEPKLAFRPPNRFIRSPALASAFDGS